MKFPRSSGTALKALPIKAFRTVAARSEITPRPDRQPGARQEELGLMRGRNGTMMKALLPLGLLAMLVAVLRRRGDEWEYEQLEADPEQEVPAPPVAAAARGERRRGRYGIVAAFTTLFFAGAAFTAGAGDQAARLMEEDAAAVVEYQAMTTADAEAAPAADPVAPADPMAVAAEPTPVEPAAAPEPEAAEPTPAAEPPAAEPSAPQPAPAPAAATAAAQAAEPAAEAPAGSTPSNVVAPAPAAPETPAPAASAPAPAPAAAAVRPASRSTRQWIVERAAAPPAREPEVEHDHAAGYGEPTVWLNRSLPDPTPASARLKRSFARQLASVSKQHGADWAVLLGVLRAQGDRSSAPAGAGQLETLAGRLAGRDPWKGALAISGRTAFADRAAALADVYRFVGLEALVTGLGAAKDRLVQKLLQTEGV